MITRRPALESSLSLLAAILLGTVMLLCSVPAALAEPSRTLGDLQAEAARVRDQIDVLDRKAAIAVERYDTARTELDQINRHLLEARRELDHKQTQLDVSQAVYGQRMADIYKSGGVSVLDVLLSTDDFTELDTHIDYFLEINAADADAIHELEALTTQVEALTAELDDRREAALAKEIDLRGRQADVEDRLAERKSLLAELDSQVREMLARRERRDAAAARRLAAAAGVNLDQIHGTPAQIALVRETMRYLGIPYVWAGATPAGGFDCSGLVLFVYNKFGVQFPHGATMQARMGTPVSFAQMQPADLVFFGSPAFYHHVGIYIGGGLFIEAPHTGDVVKVSRLAGRGCTLACRYPIRLP